MVTSQELSLMLRGLSFLDTGELSEADNDSRNRLASYLAGEEERVLEDDAQFFREIEAINAPNTKIEQWCRDWGLILDQREESLS